MNNRDFYDRRHIYLINKEFQGRFAAFVIAVLIGYSAILLLFQKLARSVSFPLMIPIVFVGLIVFVGVASMFYSHRLAGPLFAIQRGTKEIAKGDLLIKLQMRKGHNIVFHQIVENINNLTDNLHDTVMKMEDKVVKLSKETRGLSEKMIIGESKKELTLHLNKIQELEKELGDILKTFKVY